MATGRAFDKIINPDETHELEQIIAEGEYYGMQTFDQHLLGLVRDGVVTYAEACAVASNPQDLTVELRAAGLVA